MKKYIGLLLVVVILLLVAFVVAKPHTDSMTPSTEGTTSIGETKDAVPEDQNGTTATTNGTTATTEGSGETNSTEPTGGDSSSTGTTETTQPPTDAPTVPPTTPPTVPPTVPPTESTVPEDYTLKISQTSLALEAGQIGNLTVEYTGTGTIVWKSSNTSVATVSNGKVTAKAAGTTVITVTDGAKSSQCVVTVTKKVETPVEVTLKISNSTLSLKVGQSSTLNATYTGSKSLNWTSSNTSVATVSNGKVTAKAAGTAIITVTDGVKKAQCSVTVVNEPKPVEVKLSISSTSLNLVVGNTSTLTATYTGTGTLSWTSSNTSVATVSNGKVTAKAAGTAVITVTDGVKNSQCIVTVTAPATKTLKINTKPFSTVAVGGTLQIDYTYSGDKSKLTWSSDDTSIFTVDQNGVVTGKSTGTTGVIVTDGSITRVISITVMVRTTSLEMNGYNAPLYDGVVKYAGDYTSLRVWTMPTNSNRNITVTSSNSSVVSVSWEKDSTNKNYVTLNFKSAGSAKVTIASADGAISKSYNITVKGDYACNPGPGLLTPEQFVNCYNGIVSANGMSTNGMPTGYLVMTLSPKELTWAEVRYNAEGRFHAWWNIGYRTLVLTYERIDEDGNYIFYVRGH